MCGDRYARLRGVRVMPEFDMPGHAQSWCVGYPELCPSATCLTPLDVSRNSTFALIDRLLAECTGRKPHAGLFPDGFVHLGGDEVSTECWETTPRIAQWLAARGLTADDGYALFVKRAASIAIAQGRRPVQWSEVYDHFKTKLDPRVIVHVWKDVTNVTEVVANGYDVLRNVGYDKTSWSARQRHTHARARTPPPRPEPRAPPPRALGADHALTPAPPS